MKEQAIETTGNREVVWDQYWESHGGVQSWDFCSYLVWSVLKKEIGDIEGKSFAECGSGTGRISLRLIREGGKGILLDQSSNALSIGKRIFSLEKVEGKFVRGTILAIPFKDEVCDIVWNSGVLEHFSEEEQIKCLKEMSRICKKEGIVIVLCPHRSIFHRLGKALLEKLNRWPYGYEEPVASLKDVGRKAGMRFIKKEYPLGIFAYLVEAPRFLIPGKAGVKINQILKNIMISFYESPAKTFLETLDALASRLFGGYLLVSVFRRTS